MNESSIVKLGDIIEIKHGFTFKGEFFSEEVSEYILLTPGNFSIGGGFQIGKAKYYKGPVPNSYILKPNDLVVTMTDLSKSADTLGYAAVIPKSRAILLHNQRIGRVIFRNDLALPSFIHWLMRSPDYRNEVLASATGSTVKHTSPTRILNFRFALPKLVDQSAIASILDVLDHKIELNKRMNETLEAMARAIFRDWFVDFGPTRAKAEGRAPYLAPDIWSLFPDQMDDESRPEGWSERRLEEVMELAYGKALPATERADGPIPVYGSGGVTGSHNVALVEGPSIIIGRKGTVGALYWEDRPFFPIDTVFYVRPRAPLTFCYYLLQTLGLDGMNTDAAVPGLNRNNVYRLPVPWSSAVIRERFDGLVGALRRRIRSNIDESQTLAATRDLLLPKLMSGEIRVKDAERLAETASPEEIADRLNHGEMRA